MWTHAFEEVRLEPSKAQDYPGQPLGSDVADAGEGCLEGSVPALHNAICLREVGWCLIAKISH